MNTRTYFLHRTYLIFILFLFVSLNLKGQTYSPIVFDNQQSQYFGAYNLTTLHQVIYKFEDKYIRDTLFRENNFIRKTGGFFYRISKLLLLDAQIDCFIALTQHEVFGHGARFRELGYKNNSFNLNLFPPFGNGSGFSKYGTLKTGYKTPTSQEFMASNIGGVDAEMLLANNLTSQILLEDTLHYRQGLLYLITQNNLSLYLWSTRYTKSQNIKPGNDMVNYINEINYTYPNSNQNIYDVKKLAIQSLISLANPLQLYSAFSILFTYGIKGKKQLRVPMIKFGKVRYLPALNYSLSPFGSQYHFINYVRYKQLLFSGDFNIGDNTFNHSYGASIKAYNIIDIKRITINFQFDIWNQPILELEKYLITTIARKTGEAFKLDLMLRPFINKNKLGIFLQIGYKSKGYIIGEPLTESFILRYGISMHL